HYDLGPRLAYRPAGNDAQSAVQALAEGDATSTMMDYLLASGGKTALSIPDGAFASQVEASIGAQSEWKDMPRVLQASLVGPCVGRVRFVHALRGSGGWAAVDAAWRSPPESTEQLLHPVKFEAHERPDDVAPPLPPSPRGWHLAFEDTFGEQGLR